MVGGVVFCVVVVDIEKNGVGGGGESVEKVMMRTRRHERKIRGLGWKSNLVMRWRWDDCPLGVCGRMMMKKKFFFLRQKKEAKKMVAY